MVQRKQSNFLDVVHNVLGEIKIKYIEIEKLTEVFYIKNYLRIADIVNR